MTIFETLMAYIQANPITMGVVGLLIGVFSMLFKMRVFEGMFD